MVSPLLKWAGGKRWLVSSDYLPNPAQYTRYVEPFLGSAAVFFHLDPPSSLVSDLNEDLINFYKQLRDHPGALFRLMREHHKKHCKEYYYETRASKPKNDLERAGWFLYLNRTCWNGLYRVNLRGEFNVPVGTKNSVIFEGDDFEAAAKRLQRTDIRCCDFEDTLSECGEGDFVFVDPPYTVQHNLNGFLKYNEKIFSWSDQTRLHSCLHYAVERGAYVVVTNADHASIRELYSDFGSYQKLGRSSVLAGDATKRRPTSEALFCSSVK